MFQALFNRLYKMKIGTRTAISFFAVVMAVLLFTTSSILLLQYGKNIDIKIASHFSPVISSLRNYQLLIEESGRLSTDLSFQNNSTKKDRLEKILNRIYVREKHELIALCQDPGLMDIKVKVVNADKEFEKIMLEERKILSIMDSSIAYKDPQKLTEAAAVRHIVEERINKLNFRLSETSLLAISSFNKLSTQKFASYRTLSYLLLVMIVVIVLVSLFSIYITNVTIIKPIKELSAILDEVGEGKIVNFHSEVNRQDEIGTMIDSAQKVVKGFKTKEMVANAIGKGEYEINVPLLSRKDRLGKALIEMRDNLKKGKTKEMETLNSLEAYTKNLEKKNKELDQFAYITSHDLKSPLRGINNLAEWIEEDMGDKLSSESKGYFKLMKGRVHRMEALINSLLKFSRSGKTQSDQENVKTKEVVVDILKQLNPSATCSVLFDESLPEIFGNRKDIKEIFGNFISNAIEHNSNERPVVNITFKEETKSFIFCIADNGPGIPEEFQEKIFTIFQTLERRDEIENIGAGLAIVKKIVEEYGGETWVESKPHEGSRFYFKWPKPLVIVEEHYYN